MTIALHRQILMGGPLLSGGTKNACLSKTFVELDVTCGVPAKIVVAY